MKPKCYSRISLSRETRNHPYKELPKKKKYETREKNYNETREKLLACICLACDQRFILKVPIWCKVNK